VRPQAPRRSSKQRSGQAAAAYPTPTPNRPFFFEFALDTATLAHAKGIRNVFVTNGYMTLEALQQISPVLDAANVDLKAFTPKYYKDFCGAKLEHVQGTLRHMKTLGVFVEVTTLIVPGLNDDPDELKALAAFMVNDLGSDTPGISAAFTPPTG